MHQPHQHQSSAFAWPAPMPIDAKPSAPTTAAPATILFSFIVNSFISWLPCRCEGRRLAKRLAKTARRSRLFPDLYIVPPAAFASHIAWPLRYLDSGTRSPRSACDHAPGAVSTWMTSCSGSGDVEISPSSRMRNRCEIIRRTLFVPMGMALVIGGGLGAIHGETELPLTTIAS